LQTGGRMRAVASLYLALATGLLLFPGGCGPAEDEPRSVDAALTELVDAITAEDCAKCGNAFCLMRGGCTDAEDGRSCASVRHDDHAFEVSYSTSHGVSIDVAAARECLDRLRELPSEPTLDRCYRSCSLRAPGIARWPATLPREGLGCVSNTDCEYPLSCCGLGNLKAGLYPPVCCRVRPGNP
jgi:hypothetical protein